MDSFSTRSKISIPVLQIDNINNNLKNRLWNLFYSIISERDRFARALTKDSQTMLIICWRDFFSERINNNTDFAWINHFIEEKFNGLKWFEIYDLLEFILKYLPEIKKSLFKCECNFILEEENSAYRFVNNLIMPITNEIEINTIETAINCKYKESQDHIEKACFLLRNKEKPDYPNSIKESISAIEALARILLNNSSATLSQLLKPLKEKLDLHQTLIDALGKIYAYAGDESGIKHSFKNSGEKNDQADAIFLLISCSAWINLIVRKEEKSSS